MSAISLVKKDGKNGMVNTLVMLPLGDAAKAVRKHPSTLTKAANHKDPEKRLPFTVGEEGERLFSIPDLQKRFGEVYAPDDDSLVNSPVKKKAKQENSPVRASENSPSDSLVNKEEIHLVRTSALENEISMLRDQNRRLVSEVEAWKDQADKWRRTSDQNLFLLTDQREKANTKETKTTRSIGWLGVSLYAVVMLLIVLGFAYRADIADTINWLVSAT